MKRFDGEFPERFAEEIFRYLSIPAKEFPQASQDVRAADHGPRTISCTGRPLPLAASVDAARTASGSCATPSGSARQLDGACATCASSRGSTSRAPNLIKGIHLEGLRVIGDPQEYALRYYEQGADELLSTWTSSPACTSATTCPTSCERTADQVFIPITVGGGIRSLGRRRRRCCARGADKVAINTAAIARPDSDHRGRDAASARSAWCCRSRPSASRRAAGRPTPTTAASAPAATWSSGRSEASTRGAGEILLTSVDQEGTRKGFDVPLRAAGLRCGARAGDRQRRLRRGRGPRGAGGRRRRGVAIADALHWKRMTLARDQGACARTPAATCAMEAAMAQRRHRHRLRHRQPAQRAARAGALRRQRHGGRHALRPKWTRPSGWCCPASAPSATAWPNCARAGSTTWCAASRATGRPFLGICVGLQMMFDASEEMGEHAGPGPARVGACSAVPATARDGKPHRVPHIGWRPLEPRATWDGTILAGLHAGERAYFVHSFSAEPADDGVRLADVDYDGSRSVRRRPARQPHRLPVPSRAQRAGRPGHAAALPRALTPWPAAPSPPSAPAAAARACRARTCVRSPASR